MLPNFNFTLPEFRICGNKYSMKKNLYYYLGAVLMNPALWFLYKTCQPYPWPMSSLIWTPITRYLISPVASIISSLFILDNQFLPLLRIFLSPWKFLSAVGFSRLRHINTIPHTTLLKSMCFSLVSFCFLHRKTDLHQSMTYFLNLEFRFLVSVSVFYCQNTA